MSATAELPDNPEMLKAMLVALRIENETLKAGNADAEARMARLTASNRSIAEWGTVLADPVVATAILDRLLHHSHVLTIRGDSYRLRAKRRSGLIKPPADDGTTVGSASLRALTGDHQPTS